MRRCLSDFSFSETKPFDTALLNRLLVVRTEDLHVFMLFGVQGRDVLVSSV